MDENEMSKAGWIPLILISSAIFIMALNTTFPNVAVSQLIPDLNTTLSTLQLIVTFYTLIIASLILIGAKVQDIAGKKKVFLIGLATYALGVLIASLSADGLMFFVGESLLCGIGAALVIPSSLSLAGETYQDDKHGPALAIVGTVAAAAVATGPLYGGIVTTFLTWRYGFIIELVLILVIFIFSGKIRNYETALTKKDLDITGSILLIFGLMSFVLGVLLLEEDILITIALVVLSLIVLSLFTSYEYRIKQRGKTPLLDMDMLKVRNLSMGTLINLIICLVLAGALFAISVFMQGVLKLDAFTTGLNLLPATLALLLSMVIAPRLTEKISPRVLMSIGFLIAMLASMYLSVNFGLDATFSTIAPGMFFFGFGLGVVFSLGSDISLVRTRNENQNSARLFLFTGQSVGMSLGIAILGCVLIVGATWGLHDAINTYAPDESGDEHLLTESQEYLQKMGNVDVTQLQSEKSVNDQIVNAVLTDAVKGIMSAITGILAIGLLLTQTLNDASAYQLKRLKK